MPPQKNNYFADSIFWIEVEKIQPNPYQPRRDFDEAKLKDLAESIRMHPAQDVLKQMLIDAGLERVEYFNLTAGVAALHTGIKL